MATIHIFLPKRRLNKANVRRWRFNHHKKPRYLLSELNWAIRRSDDEDKRIFEILWQGKFKMKYKFKR